VEAVERDEWLRAAWSVTIAREIATDRLVRSWRQDGRQYLAGTPVCLVTEG